MSGTSADGIDAVLVELSQNNITLIDKEFCAYTDGMKSSVQSLQQNSSSSYHQVAQLDIELGLLASSAVNKLVARNSRIEITAIGSHGQTIQHRPNDTPAYTLQIGSGAVISEITGLTTVNDFRSRDIALGGQGAPFAPAFHKAFFADHSKNRVIVNIGGIANISYLNRTTGVIGFDCGPGNTLIDSFCQQYFNKNYDDDGLIAQSGVIYQTLIDSILADPFFTSKPPKSTGQEYFNRGWLESYLHQSSDSIAPKDLIATVTMLTAESIIKAITMFCENCEEIFICGGGASNKTLISFLRKLTNISIETTDALGIHPDWVEACGFAWLAKQAVENQPVDLTKITGASKDCVLGSIWQTS